MKIAEKMCLFTENFLYILTYILSNDMLQKFILQVHRNMIIGLWCLMSLSKD